LLRLELGELRDADFDLSLIGFNPDQLAGILDVTLGRQDGPLEWRPQADDGVGHPEASEVR
jgi:hypothetical protein